MADKMLRVAGRGDDGLAKPIKTDNAGNIGINLAGSKSVELANGSTALGLGGSTNATAVANNVLSKTAYVYAEKDGYAGIEVKLNEQWIPLLPAREDLFREDFTGADAPVDATKWEVAKIGTINDSLTFAKRLTDKLRMNLYSNSGTSNLFVTSQEKITASVERIFEFVVDETKFIAGMNSELNFGLTPTKPTTTSSIAGRVMAVKVREGKVISPGNTIKEYTIPTLKTNARYVIITEYSRVKIYREGVLVLENTDVLPLSEMDYHMYFQMVASTSAGIVSTDVDSFIAWTVNEDAKVTGKKLWVKSTTDVIPTEMRVVFQNGFTSSNNVTVVLMGQP